ncbi:hypothetical protein GCM10011391_28170 [Pullulanibacillus camelliae]|uniref:Phosphoadenosine phosphosulphate reductase domain-containing protein n=1 Tax=Pullulanibacillus camelliae TaxID=1707096 RepID=A0A8J3DX63_9BACL|nr:phosphoadenosine phosphosulfate reductase family protein [Pullulanibacillus camelliae]GGE47766.1 hypothetical protein GCM10011391_28170 [Pullulanibacillus camelliae]
MKNEEIETYMLHSRLPAFQKKVKLSFDIINKALKEMKNPYASISFGKDSIVLMHLLLQIAPDIDFVWSDRGLEAELPETYDYIEVIKSKYPINLTVIYPEMTMFEIYHKYGIPGIHRNADKTIVTKKCMIEPFEKYAKENQKDGYFQGVRADESASRIKMAKSYGHLFFRKRDKMWVANPLLGWSGRDIWAYIVSRDIPYHPEYDRDLYKGSREKVRISNWSGVFNAHLGRVADLKFNHPELYQKLVDEFPEVSTLG